MKTQNPKADPEPEPEPQHEPSPAQPARCLPILIDSSTSALAAKIAASAIN